MKISIKKLIFLFSFFAFLTPSVSGQVADSIETAINTVLAPNTAMKAVTLKPLFTKFNNRIKSTEKNLKAKIKDDSTFHSDKYNYGQLRDSLRADSIAAALNAKTLSVSGQNLTLSGGNSVTLPSPNLSSYATTTSVTNETTRATAAESLLRQISDTRDDSLKTALAENWKISGNNTQLSDIYNIGIKSGSAVTGTVYSQYYTGPDKIFLVGINTAAYSNATSEKVILKMSPLEIDFTARSNAKGFTGFNVTQNSFALCGQKNSNAGLFGEFNQGNSRLLFTGKKQVGSGNFDLSIYFTDTIYSPTLSVAYQDGSLVLDKGLSKVYVAKNNLLKEIAFEQGIIRKNNNDVLYLTGNTSLGGSYLPTEKLEVSGRVKADKLQIRLSVTPTSSSDTQGNTGDIAKDDDYIYIKTASGWKRAALSTF